MEFPKILKKEGINEEIQKFNANEEIMELRYLAIKIGIATILVLGFFIYQFVFAHKENKPTCHPSDVTLRDGTCVRNIKTKMIYF